MATIVEKRDKPRASAWAPDLYERFLAVAAGVLLVVVAAALARGEPHWHEVGWRIWLHLATIVVALALTPTMLLRPRGDRWHRRLGWVWAAAMVATALVSFAVQVAHPGHWSFVHILSAYVLVQVPLIVILARRHKVARHRRAVRAMVTGALLIAGFFTFPFGRMMGVWLFG